MPDIVFFVDLTETAVARSDTLEAIEDILCQYVYPIATFSISIGWH